MTYVSYAIGAVPVILVGLSTIMLNLMYPVEGGESYVYPTRVVNNYAGFLSGWAMWLALIGPVAITAKAFIMYVNALPGLETKLNVVAGAVIVTRRLGATQTRSLLYSYFISHGMIAVGAAVGYALNKGDILNGIGGSPANLPALEEARNFTRNLMEMIEQVRKS